MAWAVTDRGPTSPRPTTSPLYHWSVERARQCRPHAGRFLSARAVLRAASDSQGGGGPTALGQVQTICRRRGREISALEEFVERARQARYVPDLRQRIDRTELEHDVARMSVEERRAQLSKPRRRNGRARGWVRRGRAPGTYAARPAWPGQLSISSAVATSLLGRGHRPGRTGEANSRSRREAAGAGDDEGTPPRGGPVELMRRGSRGN